MKAFVTGADGFIGSHLAEALVSAGHEVTALAQYNSFDSYGWLDECHGMQKVRGDIRDAEQMVRLIAGHDIVFHLAALISVPDSYDRPRSYMETNALGTLNVLTAALRASARVVHTSTSEVYGTALYTPQDERHPLQAQSPYAASKIAADKIAESFHRTYGLEVVTLRPFNTYGPRQSERAVIARIIRQAVDPKCHEIRLGALEPRRDFTFVADTVNAFVYIGRNGTAGEVYNFGSGQTVSIGELAMRVCRVLGCEKHVVSSGDTRPVGSEVDCLQADHGKIGMRPSAPLDIGLERTAKWWMRRNYRADVGMVA